MSAFHATGSRFRPARTWSSDAVVKIFWYLHRICVEYLFCMDYRCSFCRMKQSASPRPRGERRRKLALIAEGAAAYGYVAVLDWAERNRHPVQ